MTKSTGKVIGRLVSPRANMTIEEKLEFFTMPIPESGCLIWIGAVSFHGYARTTINHKVHLVHRLTYEMRFGPIPKGMVIDHKCRVRSCCNPDHLEAVTSRENWHRGDLKESIKKMVLMRTHCQRGHEYDTDNTAYIIGPSGKEYRTCKKCRSVSRKKASRKWNEKHLMLKGGTRKEMINGLSECPFCGEHGRYEESIPVGLGWWAKCISPYCDVEVSTFGKTKEAAAFAWNRRSIKAEAEKEG